MRMTLEGLEQNSVYYVQLRVKYRDRPGDWSRRFELVTLKDTIKPGPVTDLAGVYSQGNLTLSWAAPIVNEDGSSLDDLKDYVVTITPVPADPEWRPAVIVAEGTKASFTKENNVAAFGKYRAGLKIVVQARDIVGNLSAPVEIVKTKPKPAKVTNLTWTVEGSDFVARWTKPTLNTDGTPFTDPDGYEIKVIHTGAPTAQYPQGQQNVVTISPHYREEYRLSFAENEAFFGGPVMPGPDDLTTPRARATLSLEVRARDSVGQVSDADPVIASNPAPSAVAGVTARPGINHVTVSWQPNNVNDGVRYYEVWVADNDTAVGSFRGRTNSLSLIFDTVQYNTTHYIYVIAVDGFGGRSPKSTVVTGTPSNPFTVDTEPPPVPTGYTASDTATLPGRGTELPAAVLVSWSPGTDNSVAGYHISYSPLTNPRKWEYKDVFVPDAVSTVVTPLEARTQYVFRVRTYDRAINPSAWSAEFQGTSTESTSDFVFSDITSDIAVIAGGSLRSADFTEPSAAVPTGNGWRLMPTGLDIFRGRVNAQVISTGELRSNTLIAAGKPDAGQPLWSLNLDGNLTVREGRVKGALIVGESGADNGNINIASYNYGAQTGRQWAMLGDGSFHLRAEGTTGASRLQITPTGIFGYGPNNNQTIGLTTEGKFALATTNGGLVVDDDGLRLYSGGQLTVDLHRSGYAFFEGEIEAASGIIGGWNILPYMLYSGSALIRSDLGLFQVGDGVNGVSMRAGIGFWAGPVDFNTGYAPFQVGVSGNLRAVSGEIGGFTIDEDRGFIGGFNSSTVAMRPGWGIWTGANNFESAPLQLFHEGTLVARKAQIEGEIKAARFYTNASMVGTGNWVEMGNTGPVDPVDEIRFKTYGGSNVASIRGHMGLPGAMVITAQNSAWWFSQDTFYTEGKLIYTNGGNISLGGGYLYDALYVSASIGKFQSGVEAGIYYDNNRGYYMRPYQGIGVEVGGYGSGRLIVNNNTSAKSFVIDHPDKPDNYLVHAVIEGPTADVYYRGEGRLHADGGIMTNGFSRVGRAEVELPAYFESLVALEGRTVMVTPICEVCEDCGEFLAPSLGAGRVKDGKFTVYALAGFMHDDAKFYWEVKGVRKDIPQFEVEPVKDDYALHGDGPYTYLTKAN